VTPTVGVVVLAWGDEPYLAECVAAIRASTGVDTRLVVVDNGSPDAPPDALRPGHNTGFAGGCNLGAAALDTEYLAFVNSDCVIAPDTLEKLVAEAAQPGVGPVMASIRLPDGLLNSGGNPVHLIGLSWAGGMGTAETRTAPYDVTGASGACLLLATTVWKQLGGFDEEYFAYLEDSELSLRAWRLGLAARCVPTAVARHHYEFSRNARKMHLLERNRLMLLATVWPRRALILLAPVLAACELGLLALGTVSGWKKVAGYAWLWRHRAHLRERRRLIQGESADRTWMARLSPTLDRSAFGPVTPFLNAVFRVYWSVVRRLL